MAEKEVLPQLRLESPGCAFKLWVRLRTSQLLQVEQSHRVTSDDSSEEVQSEEDSSCESFSEEDNYEGDSEFE